MTRTIDEVFRAFFTKLATTSAESAATKRHSNSIKTRLKLDFDSIMRFVCISSFRRDFMPWLPKLLILIYINNQISG
jgi:hypothetical protein